MFKVFFISLVVAFLFLSGCQKDELTLPTSVDFVFEMEAFELEEEKGGPNHSNNNLKAGYSDNPFDDDSPFDDNESGDFKSLKIDKSTLVITAIEIDGQREQGKDVFMVTEYDTPLELHLTGGEVSDQNISFDIPQGIYKKLDIQFYLGTDEKPAIDFNGMITPGKSPVIKFRFEYSNKERLRVRAMRDKPSDPIVLSKEKKSKARVIVDAEYMFRNITLGQLTGTKIINIPGGKEIRINRDNNKPVFSFMSGRLEKSITVVFE